MAGMHPTHFQALASLLPAPYTFAFCHLTRAAACHLQQDRLPTPSCILLQHCKARVPQPTNCTRGVALLMWRRRLLSHCPLVAPPLHPCRALRMYMVYPCLHTIKVLSFLHQQAVLWPRGYDKRLGTISSCVRCKTKMPQPTATGVGGREE